MATMAETRSAVIFVHHDAKGKPGDRSKTDRGSGSSIMGRFCDGRLILTPHKDDPDRLICVETLYRYLPPQPGITCQLEDGRLVIVEGEECVPETSKPVRVLKSDTVLESAVQAVIPDIIANGPYHASVVKTKLKDLGVANNNKQTEGVRRLKALSAVTGSGFSFLELGGGRVSFGTREALIELAKPRAYPEEF
jgi:hypothetical protein